MLYNLTVQADVPQQRTNLQKRKGVNRGITSKKKDDDWKWEIMWPSYLPPNLKFTGSTHGPKRIAIGVTHPLVCFHLFLPHELYDEIVV